MRVIRRNGVVEDAPDARARGWNPFARNLDPIARKWRARNFGKLLWDHVRFGAVGWLARKNHILHAEARLYLTIIRADGTKIPLGLAGRRLVTTAGVGFLVDALQGSVEPELARFHGLGQGGTSPAIGDTDLVTPLTTELNPNSTRATGSLTEGSSANIFRTVGVNAFDATVAITEFGLFTDATEGSGVLIERDTFSVINLGTGESLQSEYELTFPAGG